MAFSFVQITDHHLGDTEDALLCGYSPAYALRATLRHIAEHVGHHIDFIVSTGDLVDAPSDISYTNLRQMLNLRPSESAPGPGLVSLEGLNDVPMYLLPGNHDDRDGFFRHLFQQEQPQPFMNASFQHKGIQFICLDWGPGGKAVEHPELLEFLARSLRNGLPSIIITHHHLVSVGSRWHNAFLPEKAEAFWELVRGHQVLGIFSGHAHLTYDKIVKGVPVYGLRSTYLQASTDDEPINTAEPPHYRLVTVQDDVLTTRIFEVPL